MGKSKELAELGQVVTQDGGNVGIGSNPIASSKVLVTHSGSTFDAVRVNSDTVTDNTGIYLRTTGTAGISFGSTSSLAFFGGGAGLTERMRIDASGRVTMPYQPSFAAYVDGTGLTAGFTSPTTPVPYQWDHVNVGGHYNTTTSTFTAPISGTYAMNASASYGNNSVANKWVAIRFVVNGSVYYSNGYALDSVQVGPNNNSYGNVALSDIFYLNANDTVCVQAQYNTFNGNLSFGCFSGYLIG